MLTIFNSLTRQKQEFVPLVPGKIGMYVCGVTVYDYFHLGNARMLVAFDTIVRYLRARGFAVTYVRNITDIDDKIIARAQERGITTDALVAEFIQAMYDDTDKLGLLRPDFEPRASEHVAEIIALIQRLIDKDHAYVADNGDVCYRVASFADYGCLAKQDLEGLRVGARIEIAQDKEDPLDFVLWKQAKPGEPEWESPWGAGRPGWHIECSAMSMQVLGEHFDIHGGGIDLQFPHHENEIAQSQGATGKPYVNVWMHNGFVQVNDEKMSKSLGNFFTTREILAEHEPEVVRYFLLASHYRSAINYSTESLDNAKAALVRFYTALRDLPQVAISEVGEDFHTRFYQAMDDDFNTPEALAVLFDLVREINKAREHDQQQAASLAARLRELGGVLGILQQQAQQFLQSGQQSLRPEAIEALIQERKQARVDKDWARSDAIRDELQAAGVVLEDSAEGTTWRLQ